MFLPNTHRDYGKPLEAGDAAMLNGAGSDEVERFLSIRDNHRPTPTHDLPHLSVRLGVGSIRIKDEGHRLGLGSFKALGGAYAVVRLVLEEASRQLGVPVAYAELSSPVVRAVAAGMTFACATDGNHGRSVAQGAQLVGAKAVIFVHAGVSEERVAAIARFGARMIRVEGTYDDSVAQAASVSAQRGWAIVSDTSWPGYERVPGLVMQGYTAIAREALRQMPEAPTHLFIQAGVGGIAAALAGHFQLLLGPSRPRIIVVEPTLAACLFASAQAGRPVKVAHGAPTVMAMLECYEPSLVAWRVLTRIADAFMTVEDTEAVSAMNLLARPEAADPAIVAGESGCAGLAGLLKVAGDQSARLALGLEAGARILVVNTEGATDPTRYRELVGLSPEEVIGSGVEG